MCDLELWQNRSVPNEQELLDRIRQLEQLNSQLQDKLDAIYSIVVGDEEGDSGEDLVQIKH